MADLKLIAESLPAGLGFMGAASVISGVGSYGGPIFFIGVVLFLFQTVVVHG